MIFQLLLLRSVNRFFTVAGIVLFFLCTFTALNSYALDLSKPNAKSRSTPLKIVSTIKPIQLLVTEIVGQHADAQLLIPATANLHHYSLRPSDIRKLVQADIVIRISEHLESFITPLLRQVHQRRPKEHLLTLADTKGITWLAIREKHASHEPNHHSSHEDHHELNKDYHFWLNPDYVRLMIDSITHQLSLLDPTHAKDYALNSQQLKQRIQIANDAARKKLEPYQDIPYIVFHDSWHYLEQSYGLAEPQVVSLQDDLPSGIKTIRRLRQHIQAGNIHCLVTSSTSNQKVISTLTHNTSIKTVRISPLGANTREKHIENYADFIENNAEQFSTCLKQ